MLTVNEYFDGAVKSIGFDGASGSASSGVMSPGQYTFNTSAAEVMRVMYGEMRVLLAGSEQWQTVLAGEEFEVAANSSFEAKIAQPTAYLCFYS